MFAAAAVVVVSLPWPWSGAAVAWSASCCSLCCCGIDVNTPKPQADSRGEVPPSPPSPSGKSANPAPVVDDDVGALELASLAAGRVDEVIVQLADDDALAVRLKAVKRELRRGAYIRAAVWRVYGDRWATNAHRRELTALLAGRDDKIRWRPSALSHAEVKTDWPRGTETAAGDAIRLQLRTALPAAPTTTARRVTPSRIAYACRRPTRRTP